MSKLSKKKKKILSLLLAILILVTGTNVISAFAETLDNSVTPLPTVNSLGLSEDENIQEAIKPNNGDLTNEEIINLGQSGDDRDPRIKFLASPLEAMDKIYANTEFSLDISSPEGKVVIPLGSSMSYSNEMTKEYYEKIIKVKNSEVKGLDNAIEGFSVLSEDIEKLEDIKDFDKLIEFSEEKNELVLNFTAKEAQGLSEDENNTIRVYLKPKNQGVHKITAIHEGGYSNYIEVTAAQQVMTFIAKSPDFVKYDGSSVKNTAEYGPFSINGTPSTGNGFVSTSRTLSINGRFVDQTTETVSNYINRKIVVKIEKGMELNSNAVIPGLKYVGGTELWQQDLSNLEPAHQNVITSAKFTRATDSTLWYPSKGGTIEYTIGDNTAEVTVNISLVGDIHQLDSSNDITNTETGSKLLELNSMVQVNSYRSHVSTPTVIEEIDSAKIEKIKVYGAPRTVFSPDGRTAVQQGIQKVGLSKGDLSIWIYGSPSYPNHAVGQGTIKYKFKKYLTVDDVRVGDDATVAGTDFWTVTPLDANYNLLTINFTGIGKNYGGFYLVVTPDATAPIGPADMEFVSADVAFPFEPNGKITAGRTVKIDVYGATKEQLTPLNATTNIHPNSSPDSYPLGGFRVVNKNAEHLLTQRIKMFVEDTKIDVKGVKLETSDGTYKNVTMKLRGGRTATKASVSSPYVNIKDFFADATATDSIEEVSYQPGRINAGAFWGAPDPNVALYAHLVYYGRINGTFAVGDSYTAKIFTTTAADENFAGTPELPVQTATTTTQYTSTATLRYKSDKAAATYNVKAGESITLSMDISAADVLSANGWNSQSYVKGYSVYLRKIPGMNYVSGSFKATDLSGKSHTVNNTGTYTNSKGYEVTKFNIPDAEVSMFNGVQRKGFKIEYSLQAEATAAAGVYDMKTYMLILPDDGTVISESFDQAITYTDIEDLENTGEAKLALTHKRTTSISLTTPTNFVLATGARLDGSPWKTYDYTNPDDKTNGRIVLNPDGVAEYGFFMNNSSTSNINSFTAYIPIPKKGQWAAPAGSTLRPSSPAAYNPAEHIQDQAFGWDTFLGGQAQTGNSSNNALFDVYYSTSYEIDSLNSSNWKTWAQLSTADKLAVKTVIVKSNAVISAGDNIEVTFPLSFDTNQANVDADAGKINTYSAILEANIPGIVVGSKNSQPTSIILKTGVIAGNVYKDENANGQKDPSESYIENIWVRAYPTGTFNPADHTQNLIEERQTNSSGVYRFSGLDKTQKVDIIFFNPENPTDAKFTVPGQASQIIDGHKMAIIRDLTPSDGSYTTLNAALTYAYTINFDMNGAPNPTPATVAPAKAFATENIAAFTVLDIPNFKFNGWFTKALGGTEVKVTAPKDIYTVVKEIKDNGGTDTLYAQYTRKTSDITVIHKTYTDDKSTAVTVDTNTYIGEGNGLTFTVTKKVITGYDYDSADPELSFTVNGNKTVTVYYKAQVKKVTVNHYKYTNDKDLDKQLVSTEQKDVFYGNNLTITPKTDITGYSYDSSSSNNSATNVINDSVVLNLYYRANPAVITVEYYRFDTDPLSAVKDNTLTQTINKRYGEAYTANKITITGYAFHSSDHTDAKINAITGDETIKMYYQAGAKTVDIEHHIYTYTIGDGSKFADTQQGGLFGKEIVINKQDKPGYEYESSSPALSAGMKYTIQDTGNTVKLYYKAIKYNVVLDENNGSTATTQQLPFGTKITMPANPTKIGYTFANAWLKPDGTAWNFTSDTVPIDGITLTAKYTINNHDVTFDVNGGTAVVPNVVPYNYGELIVKPSTTRVGYKLNGWKNGAAVWDFDTDTMPDTDITLVADWQVDTTQSVTYTFNLNGGKYDGSSTNPTQTKNAGSQLDEYPVVKLTKPGMTFQAWYTDPTAGSQWIFTDTLENNLFKNTTLYARWVVDTVNPMEVDFDLAGGSYNALPSVGSQMLIIGDKVTKPTGVLAKEGHDFGGWYVKKADGTLGSAWNFDTAIVSENFGDMTLIAKWNIKSYKVTYDADNGSSNKQETYQFAVKLTKPANPVKTGHTFVDWYNGATVWNFATETMPANDITLKAKWSVNNYNLTVDADNGSPKTTQAVAYNTTAVAPAQPSKTGYDFLGWRLLDDSGNMTTDWNFTSSRMPAKDITVKAEWKIKSYTITVNHYTYVDKADTTTVKLVDTKNFTVQHFSKFTAEPISIDYHMFIAKDSDPTSFDVTGDKVVNLYYKADKYTLSLVSQLELDVNDKYPVEVVNKPSWDVIKTMLKAGTINSNAVSRSLIMAASTTFTTIESPDYDSVDFNNVTDGYTQSFTVNAKWPNGDVDSKQVKVKISDREAPEIMNLDDNRRILFIGDEAKVLSESDLLTKLNNRGIYALDNYDGPINMGIEYPGDKGYESIDWKKSGEYAIYLTAKDAHGLSTKTAAVIMVMSFDGPSGDGGNSGGSGGGNTIDRPSPNPGGNGSGNGNVPNGPTGNGNIPGTGGGSGSNNNGGNTNNSGGNSFDKNGNLVDNKGNVLATPNEQGQLIDAKGNVVHLDGNSGGKLPKTGEVIVLGIIPLAIISIIATIVISLKKKKRNNY